MKKIKIKTQQRQWLDLLFSLTKKRIKNQYKHTRLGFLWVIINPILQMLSIGFIFKYFMVFEFDNYFLFLISGLLPWNFFATTINKTNIVIVNERQLIQKAKFPRETIVLSAVLANMFDLIFSLFLLIIVLVGIAIYQSSSILSVLGYILNIIYIAPLLIWLLAITSGLSLLFSALQVRHRDTSFVIKSLLLIWFYATPIIYQLKLLPQNIQLFFYLNPMTAIIENFHHVLLKIPFNQTQYLLEGNVLSLLFSIIIAYIGWIFFQKESKLFDDWL